MTSPETLDNTHKKTDKDLGTLDHSGQSSLAAFRDELQSLMQNGPSGVAWHGVLDYFQKNTNTNGTLNFNARELYQKMQNTAAPAQTGGTEIGGQIDPAISVTVKPDGTKVTTKPLEGNSESTKYTEHSPHESEINSGSETVIERPDGTKVSQTTLNYNENSSRQSKIITEIDYSKADQNIQHGTKPLNKVTVVESRQKDGTHTVSTAITYADGSTANETVTEKPDHSKSIYRTSTTKDGSFTTQEIDVAIDSTITTHMRTEKDGNVDEYRLVQNPDNTCTIDWKVTNKDRVIFSMSGSRDALGKWIEYNTTTEQPDGTITTDWKMDENTYGRRTSHPERDEYGKIFGYKVTEEGSKPENNRTYYTDNDFKERDKRIDLPEFKTRALAIFDRIDTDGDGILSNEELSMAEKNPSFAGRDAQVVAALYLCRDKLSKLTEDGDALAGTIHGTDKGLSRIDIKKLGDNWDALKEERRASELAYWADRSEFFPEIDKDADGTLTKAELESALKNATLDSRMRDYAYFMLSKYDEIARGRNLLRSPTINKLALDWYLKTVRNSEAYKLQDKLLFYLDPNYSNMATSLQSKGIR